MTTIPRSNVTNAAKLLDKEVPGWHKLVQPEKIIMSDCSKCVLGQLFGSELEEKVEAIIGCELPPLVGHGFGRGEAFLRERGRDYSKTAAAFSSEVDLKCWWVEEIADRVAQEEMNGSLSPLLTSTNANPCCGPNGCGS